MQTIFLSPSDLAFLFLESPWAFHQKYRQNIKRPPLVLPKIFNAIDASIKLKYLDKNMSEVCSDMPNAILQSADQWVKSKPITNPKYPNFEIWDSNDDVVIPAGIHAINDMLAVFYFSFPSTGVAIASFSGISGAPNATTASYALTSSHASFALNATTASHAVTASYLLGQSPTSSYALTASYVELSLAAISSSYAATASIAVSSSYALNATTASYANNFIVGNTLTIDQTLTDYHTVESSAAGENNMFNQNTGSYSSAFFKYTVANGANARTGEIMAVWNDGSIQYTDNSTVDIGDTSGVVAEVAIAASSVQFNITTATSGWKLKSLGTFM
jgi:hypothetical protein